MIDAENNRPVNWGSLQSLTAKAYDCPFCGNRISSVQGYKAAAHAEIYVCSHCQFPTFWGVLPDGSTRFQLPGPKPGKPVANLPPDVIVLYEEARNSVAAGANTAAVLVCRKMLVDLAVSQGETWAKGKPFTEYVKYLADRVFAPTYSATWLDRIRQDGNKATHELGLMRQADAMLLIEFIEMLLRVLFEYPHAASAPSTTNP